MSVKKAHSKASNPPAKRTQSTDASMSDSTESPDNLQVKSSNDSKTVFEYDYYSVKNKNLGQSGAYQLAQRIKVCLHVLLFNSL